MSSRTAIKFLKAVDLAFIGQDIDKMRNNAGFQSVL